MKNLKIPKNEKKVKMLTVPVTPTEHQKIKQYCKEQNVTLTAFVRYALQKTYNLKSK
ncbi:hypothetical protein N9164_07355 [Draconibacterium sp.]|nr:hypothetical protein [Draconibacterium sp.]